MDTSFLIKIGVDPKEWEKLTKKFAKVEQRANRLKAKFAEIKSEQIGLFSVGSKASRMQAKDLAYQTRAADILIKKLKLLKAAQVARLKAIPIKTKPMDDPAYRRIEEERQRLKQDFKAIQTPTTDQTRIAQARKEANRQKKESVKLAGEETKATEKLTATNVKSLQTEKEIKKLTSELIQLEDKRAHFHKSRLSDERRTATGAGGPSRRTTTQNKKELSEYKALNAEIIKRRKQIEKLTIGEIKSHEVIDLSAKRSQRATADATKDLDKLFDKREKLNKRASELAQSEDFRTANAGKKLKAQLKDIRIDDIPELKDGVFDKKQMRLAHRQLGKVEKGIKNYEKALWKLDRPQSIINSKFGSFSIIMSGIAASLFVFQEAMQLGRLILSPILDAEKAWTNLNTTINLTNQEIKAFYDAAVKADISGTMKLSTAVDRLKEFKKMGFEATDSIAGLAIETEHLAEVQTGTLSAWWASVVAKFREGSRAIRGLGGEIKAFADELNESLKPKYTQTGQLIEPDIPIDKFAPRNRGYDIPKFHPRKIDEIIFTSPKQWEEYVRQLGKAKTALGELLTLSKTPTERLEFFDAKTIKTKVDALRTQIGDSPLLEIYKSDLEFKNTIKYMKPFLNANKEVYNKLGTFTKTHYAQLGILAQEYYDKLERVADPALVKRLRRQEKFSRDMKALESERLGFSKEKIKTAESIFTELDIVTPNLNKIRQFQNEVKQIYIQEYGSKEEKAQAPIIALKDDLQLYKDNQKARLQLEEQYYKDSKVMSDWLYKYKANLIYKEVDLLKAQKLDPQQAGKVINERLKSLDVARDAPKVEAWKQQFAVRRKYSEGYYDYIVKQSKWIRDKQIEYTGDVTEAHAAFYRVMLGHQIDYAKSSDNIQAGINAVYKQRELDRKTEGEKAFNRMQSLMGSVEGNIKGTLGRALRLEFTSVTDVITDMGTRFRDTIGQMAIDAMSANLMESLFDTSAVKGASSWFLGWLGGGSSTSPAYTDNWVNFGTTGHVGGVARQGGFSQLPRFHSGLKSDEFPAVLQRGEAVIPKGKVDGIGGGNVTVNVHPPAGQQAQVKENSAIGTDRDIEIYFANSVFRGGPVATAMEQTYGVKRIGRRV